MEAKFDVVKQVRDDLAPFIDPGTTIKETPSAHSVELSWVQKRRDVSATFCTGVSGEIEVLWRGERLSYRSFFASEHMADIRGIAKTSLDVLNASLYIETKAKSAEFLQGEGPAITVINSLVRADSLEYTNFVMITGEAGAGKTSVLKELVSRQAKGYLAGEENFVYLYVNAQGRALARFNEALATELNELRVDLPHYAVASMVRMGLIVPVIDGFDELIGVGGYDDAFSSISAFVDDLSGHGALVASARSTYYEQEFLARATRAASNGEQAWRLSSATVMGWGDGERATYVESIAGATKADGNANTVLSELRRIFAGSNQALGSKPLFVARAADAVLERADIFAGDGALLERLVQAFINREQKEKLLTRSGDPILGGEDIRSMCRDLAEEMWNLGTRELDRLTVRDIAEFAMPDSVVSVADRNTVIERMPSMAFLQPGEGPGSVAFEHEIFFDYFLAERVAIALGAGTPSLALLLGRSSMPESLADAIAQRVLESETYRLAHLLESLAKVSKLPGARQQVVQENAGRIIAAAFQASEDEVLDAKIESVIFPGSDLHGVRFRGAIFSGCLFKRPDLTDTVFDDCEIRDCAFESPLISRGTVLDARGLMVNDFIGIRVVNDGGARAIFDPRDLVLHLAQASLPSVEVRDEVHARAVDGNVVDMIERLARAYTRCNPICVQDDYLHSIFEHEFSDEVVEIGEQVGVFRREIRAANGPRRNFVRRLVLPEHILAGIWEGAEIPPQIRQFWERIEDRFPKVD